MFTFLLVIHIIVSVLMVVIILLQQSKGGGMSAMFGGGQDSPFGAGGAEGFFSKLTTVLAIVFMVTSFTLALMSGGRTAAPDTGIGNIQTESGDIQPQLDFDENATTETPGSTGDMDLPVQPLGTDETQ